MRGITSSGLRNRARDYFDAVEGGDPVRVFRNGKPIAGHGSDKVSALCRQAESLIVSFICVPELIFTQSRLMGEKRLTRAVYRKLKDEAIADPEDADICQIIPAILASIAELLFANVTHRQPLRVSFRQ